jgi:hypothetical protein
MGSTPGIRDSEWSDDEGKNLMFLVVFLPLILVARDEEAIPGGAVR